MSRILTGLLVGLLLLLPSSGPAATGEEAQSFQPEGRGGLGPDRDYDISRLVLDLAIDLDAGRVEGSATHHLSLLGRPSGQLAFHQTALVIAAVKVDGEDAAFRTTDEWLYVTLPEGAGAEAALVEVRIDYSAEPTTGLHFRRAGRTSSDDFTEVWSQGEDIDNRHWFPTWDHPSDRFDYEGHFTVDSDYTVLSNGGLVAREKQKDGTTRWSYLLEGGDLVSYLVMVAAGPYEHYADSWRGREVSYYVPPGTGEEVTRMAVEETPAMLDFFSEVTGIEYPYPDYKQIFVQRFIYSGMENTTATIMSERLLHPPEAHEHSDDWTESVVAHELAHQWYGDQLTCGIWREMWLNEGFATFFATLWMAQSRGEEYAARETWNRYGHVRNADDRGARPLVTRFWNSKSDARSNPYSKGSSVLQMLRVYLGDEVFFAGIRKYSADNQHQAVETEDLRSAFEAVSGERLDWFFDQWVFLAGHPELSVSHSVNAEAGTLRVSVRQTHKVGGHVPRFVLPVELEIGTTEGVRIERIWVEDGEASVLFPLEGELRWLGFDPRGGLLAAVEQSQSPDEWLAQLAESAHPFARLRAIDGLGKRKGTPTEAMRTQLGALIGEEGAALSYRLEALKVVGGWRDAASTERLLKVLEDEGDGSARLRDTACKFLGKGPSRKDVITALDQRLSRDPSPHVKAAALGALAGLLGEKARGRAMTALQGGRTHRNVLESKGASILGRYGRTEDLKALATYRRRGTEHGLLHAALWASVRIAGRAELGKERRDARRPVARDAERLLYDLNLRTRQGAVSALRSVGDSRSIEELRALVKRENHRPLADAAEGAIESIRKRDDKAHDPTPAEVEARLKKLEERLEAAEADLKRLEERP